MVCIVSLMVDLHVNKMAAHFRFKWGRMPLSTMMNDIRYAFGTLALKYGSLGIKLVF